MIETVTIDSATSPAQMDLWRRLWEVLLEPKPEQPIDDEPEADDQER
jgi:hypothetical protein